MKLLDAAGNDETGAWHEVANPGNVHHSHVRSVYVQGTLGAGSIVLEASTAVAGTTPTARNTSIVTTLTALGLSNISVRARQLRARTVGGAGNDVDVTLV